MQFLRVDVGFLRERGVVVTCPLADDGDRDARVLHERQGRVLESCRVIRRRPARLSSRPNSSEYHSGWTGMPSPSVIAYSPPWYHSSPASPGWYAVPAAARSSIWSLRSSVEPAVVQ